MTPEEISKETAKQIGLLSMQLVTIEAQNRAIIQGQAIILNLLTNKEKADKDGEALWLKTLYQIYERQLLQITSDLSESEQRAPIGIFRKDSKN